MTIQIASFVSMFLLQKFAKTHSVKAPNDSVVVAESQATHATLDPPPPIILKIDTDCTLHLLN